MVTRKCTQASTIKRWLRFVPFFSLFFFVNTTHADPEKQAPNDAPAAATAKPSPPLFHHIPISSASAGEPLRFRALITAPHLIGGAYIVYRTKNRWFTLKILRGEDGYEATIPAEHVTPPELAYAIELELTDGTRTAVFASRQNPHPVVVHEDVTDVREAWLLNRVSGRRSLVSASVDVVRFGTSTGRPIPCGSGQTDCKEGEQITPAVDDQYVRAEASYTYRPFRTVSEFGFRLGVVRGRSLVDTPVYESDTYDVGLNYAGANVRFRLANIFHTEFELLGNVTEVGFSTGVGASVLLGDPLGTKFTFGFQSIGFSDETYFGTRFFTRLDLKASERITVAPVIEVTDMPHAGEFGVRLLADGGLVLGRGFTLWLRAGYQARVFRSGGPTVGTTLQYGF